MNVRDAAPQTNAQGFGEDHVYITRWETTKKAVQVHKEPVGFLLKSVRSTELKYRTLVKGVTLCMSSEPFFDDSTYQHVKRDISIPRG